MSSLPLPLLEQHLNEIFDYIWDEENLSANYFTMLRVQLADYALSTGHPTGVLIKSLTAPPEDALNYALQAEEMGCTHPRLNVIIGMRYYQGYEKNMKVVGRDLYKALHYLEKGVRGMSTAPYIKLDGCALVLEKLSALHSLGKPRTPLDYFSNRYKAIRYMEDFINQGCIEGELPWRIGRYYEEVGEDRKKIIRGAFKRAMDMGRSKAALKYVKFPSHGDNKDNTQAMLLLMASLGKPGVGLISTYVNILHILFEPSYNPPHPVTKLYKDKICMAQDYCDTLISLGCFEGYLYKGLILERFNHNKKKAREVWLEADARGLASFAIYGSLGFDLKSTKNGWQRLLFCRKGFDLGRTRHKKTFLEVMIDIYKMGVPPIAKNPEKVLELERIARCYRDDETKPQMGEL